MTFSIRRFDQVVLGVHAGTSPSDAEWDEWLALMVQQAPAERLRVIVEAYESGGPDARQRRQLRSATSAYVDYRTAVFTDSMLTRGIITAVAWLGVPVRGFGFGDHRPAFDFLDLSAAEVKCALPILDELRFEAGADVFLHAATRPRVSRLSLIRRSLSSRDSQR